ncbi:MAG: hypothetical protein LAO21_00395 [Acidobacteriia bacterium]|nr:hypothetical protein [Terriglobia bacterium]
MTPSHEGVCFGSRDPLAFPRITGCCDRREEIAIPKNGITARLGGRVRLSINGTTGVVIFDHRQ